MRLKLGRKDYREQLLQQKQVLEIVAKDSADGFDWIEFYVTGTSSVNLSNYTIKDEDSELIALPNVTLASGEFYRVYATTDETEELEKNIRKLKKKLRQITELEALETLNEAQEKKLKTKTNLLQKLCIAETALQSIPKKV